MMRAMLITVMLAACTAPPAGSTAPQEKKVPMPSTPSQPPPPDSCGAAALQRLVGRPRSEIPPAPPGSVRRVACTTCPVTMDYNPNRLNIFYNERTGIIERVSCG